ncbi:MAG: hypothetical protein MRZ90_03570 [Candidatus Gastranaerophilales bacterium]|nr:hypothetical protein [Candidatus Gastranaerophilales bacterium]
MLSPELTKFIFNYQNDNKDENNKKNKKNISKKAPLKSRSIKFMTKLGFIPVHIEK